MLNTLKSGVYHLLHIRRIHIEVGNNVGTKYVGTKYVRIMKQTAF